MCSLQLVSDSNKHSLPLTLPVKELLFFVLFLSTNIPAYSQQKPFRIYTVNDGLISNAPQHIFQDRDGFIWMGSNEGLSIYNGYRFVNYNTENGGLSEKPINSFFEKNKEEIWVLHNSSVDVFVKRRFIKTLPLTGLNYILRAKDGRLLATGYHGIYEIKGEKRNTIFSFTNELSGFFEMGNCFVARQYAGDSIFIFDQSFKKLAAEKKTGNIFKDRYGRFWLSGLQLNLIDTTALQKGIFKLLPAPASLGQFKNDKINFFFIDTDSFYWVSIANKGILSLDRNGNSKKFNLSNGLNTNNISSFFEDQEGNIWVCTWEGIVKFFSKDIDVFSTKEGLASPFIISTIEDLRFHSIWMTRQNGISCLYQNKIYNFSIPGNKSWINTSIFLQGDSLWVGTPGLQLFRISYYPKPHLKLLSYWSELQGIQAKLVSDMHPYKDGTMLVNFVDVGLFRVTKESKLQKIHDGLFFNTFLITGDELWSASGDRGITKWKVIPEKESLRLQLLREYNQLPSNNIRCAAKDEKGNYWFGTRFKGILKFEKQKNDSFLIRNYTIQQGLAGNWIRTIFINTKGELYTCSSYGLCLLQTSGDSVCFKNLSRKYGLTAEINSITESNAGDLWLSTPDGVLRLRNNSATSPILPKIFITAIFNNNHPDTAAGLSTVPGSFSYQQNNLSFEFASTSFRNEDQMLYSYKLEGGKDNEPWSEPEKIHNLSFASLSAGDYTFKVKALSVDNVWSEVPAQYSFIIRPPYWETWWFRILVILIVAGVIAGLFWFRLRQLRNLVSLRTKISRDLHDEIGSTLTSINILSKVSQSNLEKDKDKASELLQKISEQSQNMQQSMSDIVWAIRPDNDKMENMAVRMREYLGQTAEAKDLQVEFHADEKTLKENLTMQQRRNVFLIFKEAVNNAVKYSQGKKLVILLKKENNQFKLSIQDDGIGFHIGTATSSSGLKNMSDRAKELKGKLLIHSSKNDGTVVELSCPTT